MLYDQINNVTESENLYSGGFSILGITGEHSQLNKKKNTTYKKLGSIIEQLKKDNDLGSIYENKRYFEVTTESYCYLLRDSITMWIFHVFDKEQKTLYKIFVYGSPKNLISHNESYLGGGSSMHAFFTVLKQIFEELYNTNEVKFERVDYEHGNAMLANYYIKKTVDQMTFQEMINGLFWWGDQYQMRFRGMYGGCRMIAKEDYRSSHVLSKEDDPLVTYPLNNDSNEVERVVYIIGSPLYVESIDVNLPG